MFPVKGAGEPVPGITRKSLGLPVKMTQTSQENSEMGVMNEAV